MWKKYKAECPAAELTKEKPLRAQFLPSLRPQRPVRIVVLMPVTAFDAAIFRFVFESFAAMAQA